MESGIKYVICKEGLIKFIVLLFGCTTFALLADSNSFQAPPEKTWAFAAFIIAFSISFLFYFFHLIDLASRMNCGGSCTYVGFEFLWSWLSTILFFSASIALAMNVQCTAGYPWCDKQIASCCLAFGTTIAYGVEAFFLKGYAPANVGYIATFGGWLKTAILVFGGAAFSLLADSGYPWCWGGCEDGMTYALVAYCVGWGITLFIFVALMFVPKSKTESKGFTMFEFGWSIFCVLLFISASSCFAAFMRCENDPEFRGSICKKRLGGVLAGFIAAVLYIVDAVINRPK